MSRAKINKIVGFFSRQKSTAKNASYRVGKLLLIG
jgi:hypothetical protein